ncbi:unnamed protein product, partial [Onchocerca ochengi]|uniref:Uncharacterized protein n=1 Tax=Onchocerca ochengi TaxID=42157 RepID=A0A182EUZ5_ONCOC
MELFRNNTQKFPISFYGVVNCTVFIVMKFEDFEKVKLENTECNKSYNIRAILLDSYITVLRTKDGKNVEAVRIKASLDYEDVEKAVMKNEVIAYKHKLLDSEFEKNNTFQIAPNTFDTIHVIGEYLYYQYEPRTECIYNFRRRKITKALNKEIKNAPFPALA